jgi:hypothetical protein
VSRCIACIGDRDLAEDRKAELGQRLGADQRLAISKNGPDRGERQWVRGLGGAAGQEERARQRQGPTHDAQNEELVPTVQQALGSAKKTMLRLSPSLGE